MSIQTGAFTDSATLLALYRFHMNAAEHELAELGLTRDDVLLLIRSIESKEGGYRETELLTIARQLLTAYCIGRRDKP